MAATLVFKLTNDYSPRKNFRGICTAIAFNWAYYTLKKGSGLKSAAEIPIDIMAIEAQMAVMMLLDGQEEKDEYLERFKLALVKGADAYNFADIEKFAKENPPHVVVFWNSHHTMGYRYAHLDKEFFDVEKGLFRANKTKDIDAKMNEIFITGKYRTIQHCVAVKLRD